MGLDLRLLEPFAGFRACSFVLSASMMYLLPDGSAGADSPECAARSAWIRLSTRAADPETGTIAR